MWYILKVYGVFVKWEESNNNEIINRAGHYVISNNFKEGNYFTNIKNCSPFIIFILIGFPRAFVDLSW